MSEDIIETIIPDTYIAVRPEGLLTIGAIPTGNIGIIGTAEKGSKKIEILSNFEEGKAKFGEIGEWDPNNTANNLALVRSLKLAFDNGAGTVYAQRIYDEESAKTAAYQMSDVSVLKLKAKTPGTWGNRIQIKIEEPDGRDPVNDELVTKTNGLYTLSAQEITAESRTSYLTVYEDGLAKKYKITLGNPSAADVQVNPANRTLKFLVEPSSTAEVYASYQVPNKSLRKITLRYGNEKPEEYIVPSISYLAQCIGDEQNPSKLVEVESISGNGLGLPKITSGFELFKGGDNGTISSNDFEEALYNFVEQDIQILIVAGSDQKMFTSIKKEITGHLEKTENIGRERMAVIGADSSVVDEILENANQVADKRVILVAPGLKQTETGRIIELPPSFTAAAIAGKLSSLSPHISLTNKTLLGIDNLAEDYNYGELKLLVQNRVLTIQNKRGIRVVKGITTHDEAFKQITLRRIVDYVKEGTRLGANQYIGKLNNSRVRENLRTTLEGFLADLVAREFLTGYKLKVFADRAMEIRGEVQVIMDLNPTFSIDVIRVTMNLQ